MTIYILYFIFFAILAVEYEIYKFNPKPLLITSIILLGLLAGLRGSETSRDYYTYQESFDFIYDNLTRNDGVFLPIFEPGFMGIVVLFRSIFIYNYGVAIMLFFAFASVILKILSFKKFTANPFLAILFFYSQYFLLHEMTQIRIGLASAIFFIALFYYFSNNYKMYVLLILLATLFHYSAILYLFLLLFKKDLLNRNLYCGLLILAITFSLFTIPLINLLSYFDPASVSGRLTNYAMISEKGLAKQINVFNVVTIINYILCFYLLFGVPKLELMADRFTVFFLKCNIISILILPLFSSIPSMAFRCSELFGISSMFLFASLVKYLPFKKINLVIVVSVALLIFCVNIFYANLVLDYHIINFK